MSKLLPNLPIEDLTSENDYLNVIERGDMIKSFLLSNKEEFNQIKMFALYGEWGSGKSTLMKYLQKELKSDFNTFFFEAWEFENSGNLSLSLLEYLNDKSFIKEQFKEDILRFGSKLFRGVGNSIKIDIPLSPGGPKIRIDPSKLVGEFSKEDKSFYKSKKKFQTEFKRWETFVSKSENPNYNIVFIDDLDRCEPENVLNLLSSLKLFFTYGEKTVFFCGVDKKAVETAIKTKYGDVVKSEEYLEKVFDVTFNLSNPELGNKLINHYFPSSIDYKYQNKDKKIYEIINEFFNFLRFTNPRKIKKTLNKYILLRNIGLSIDSNHKYYTLFPNILEEEVYIFDLLITLYFIILKEFYIEEFKNIVDDALRSVNYESAIRRSHQNKSSNVVSINVNIQNIISNHYRDVIGLKEIFKALGGISEINNFFRKLSINFAPVNPEFLSYDSFDNPNEFLKKFKTSKKGIDYQFCLYLLKNIEPLFDQDIESNSSISKIYKLVNLLT